MSQLPKINGGKAGQMPQQRPMTVASSPSSTMLRPMAPSASATALPQRPITPASPSSNSLSPVGTPAQGRRPVTSPGNVSRSSSTPQLGAPTEFEEKLITIVAADPDNPSSLIVECRSPSMLRSCGKYLKAYVVAVDTQLLKGRGIGDGINPFKAARKRLVAQDCLCAPKYRLKDEFNTFTMNLNPSPSIGGKAQVLVQVVIEATVDPNFWMPVGRTVELKAQAPNLELIVLQEYGEQNPAPHWADRIEAAVQTDPISCGDPCGALVQSLSHCSPDEPPSQEDLSDDDLLAVNKIIRDILSKRKLVDEVEAEFRKSTEDGEKKSKVIDQLSKLLEEAGALEVMLRKEIQQGKESLANEVKVHDGAKASLADTQRTLEEEKKGRAEVEGALTSTRQSLEKETQQRQETQDALKNVQATLDTRVQQHQETEAGLKDTQRGLEDVQKSLEDVQKRLEEEVKARRGAESSFTNESIKRSALEQALLDERRKLSETREVLEEKEHKQKEVEQALEDERKARSAIEEDKIRLHGEAERLAKLKEDVESEKIRKQQELEEERMRRQQDLQEEKQRREQREAELEDEKRRMSAQFNLDREQLMKESEAQKEERKREEQARLAKEEVDRQKAEEEAQAAKKEVELMRQKTQSAELALAAQKAEEEERRAEEELKRRREREEAEIEAEKLKREREEAAAEAERKAAEIERKAAEAEQLKREREEAEAEAERLKRERDEKDRADKEREEAMARLRAAEADKVAVPDDYLGANRTMARVKVVKATGLMAGDVGGKSDPYCVVRVVGRNKLGTAPEFKTDVMKKTLEPVWEQEHTFDALTLSDELYFEVYDHDDGKKDDLLGTVTIGPLHFRPDGFEGAVALEKPVAKGNLLSRGFSTVTKSVSNLRGGKQESLLFLKIDILPLRRIPGEPRCFIKIESAKGLRKADLTGKSDPYAICEVPNKPMTRFQTEVKKKTLEPVWMEEGEIKEYSTGDPLQLKVYDHDSGKQFGDPLGQVLIPASEFEANGFDGTVQLTGEGSKEGAIVKVCIDIF